VTDGPELSDQPEYRATMEHLKNTVRKSPAGVTYWLAREIYTVLGYVRWENFQEALKRAATACEKAGAVPSDHFRETTKVMKVGNGADMRVSDFFLSRTACYLVAMNGDPSKAEIAAAQAYFAVQTRRMELRDEADAQLEYEERRLESRERVTESFKRVSKVAQEAGVRNTSQGIFHDARYRGLYNAPLKAVRIKKGIGEKENFMDRAGPFELSTHDFQMNLAAKVITREGIKSEPKAIALNQEVAARVRKVIEDSGSPLPEDLPIEPPIKEIEARVKGKKQLPKPPIA
jgi:DNA-damage-inducible protein D